MNNKAIVYSTDKVSYLKMLKYALLTLPDINYETFDIVLNINENVKNSKSITEILEILKLKNATVIINSHELDGVNPILQWLNFPILEKYEFLIISDVDVLHLPKTDFNELIYEFSHNSNKIFGGIRESIHGNDKVRESYNRVNEMKGNFPDIKEPFNEKFINTGVVVINNFEFNNKYPEFTKNYKKILTNYTKLCDVNELNHTDQNFIYFNFFGDLDYIDNKWNVRFSHKNDIANMNANEGIIHYCIKMFLFRKWKLEKIPYTDFLEESLQKMSSEYLFDKNYRSLIRCKPNLWFPFRRFTKIGARDRNVKINLKNSLRLIFENLIN